MLLTFWLLSHSVKALGAPNSHLHLHPRNFHHLHCPGVDIDLSDINSLLCTDFTGPAFYIYLFSPASDFHHHRTDVISHKLRNLKSLIRRLTTSWTSSSPAQACALTPPGRLQPLTSTRPLSPLTQLHFVACHFPFLNSLAPLSLICGEIPARST